MHGAMKVEIENQQGNLKKHHKDYVYSCIAICQSALSWWNFPAALQWLVTCMTQMIGSKQPGCRTECPLAKHCNYSILDFCFPVWTVNLWMTPCSVKLMIIGLSFTKNYTLCMGITNRVSWVWQYVKELG